MPVVEVLVRHYPQTILCLHMVLCDDAKYCIQLSILLQINLYSSDVLNASKNYLGGANMIKATIMIVALGFIYPIIILGPIGLIAMGFMMLVLFAMAVSSAVGN